MRTVYQLKPRESEEQWVAPGVQWISARGVLSNRSYRFGDGECLLP